MTQANDPNAKQHWSRTTSILLLVAGLFLGLASVGVVYSMGQLPWHSARDAELQATYDTYQSTGVLLIKPTGSGSYGVQAPTPGPLAAAAWDDDPGAYIVASLLGPVTGLTSPYPGLMMTQGLLLALAWIGLPTAVARVFRSARAGFALLALPPLLWLLNHGAVLIGTAYGLSNEINTLPVYALYGIAASLSFLSLSVMLLLATFKLNVRALITITLLIGLLAGFNNLFRSLSGFGVALAVGVLWWLNTPKSRRLLLAAGGALSAVLLATVVQSGVMAAINPARVEATGQTIQELPDAHAVWHSMYMGLSYPEPLGGEKSSFGVTWSDEYGWAKAREIDPDVVIQSEEYDEILKDLYWEEVSVDPLRALAFYAQKFGYVLTHFAGMLALIVVGFVFTFVMKGPHRRATATALAIAVPTAILGLAPPVLVMPMLYYYSELSAALGLLFAVALGALGWALPKHVARITVRVRGRGRSRDEPTKADEVATSAELSS
jgi:hypothetical protein